MSKKNSTPKVPHYYMTMDFGICHGPIDSINQVFIKEKPIWCGYMTEPSAVFINQPEIFGGDEKEGGVHGTMECYFGTPDQTMTAVLANKLGLTPETAPGYKNIAHAVFRGTEEGEDKPADEDQSDNVIVNFFTRLLSALATPSSFSHKGWHWITNNPYLPSTWINLTRLPKTLSTQYSMIIADTGADYEASDPYLSTWVLDTDLDPDEFELGGWNTYSEPYYNTPFNLGRPPTVINLIDGLGIPRESIDLGGVGLGTVWTAATIGLIDGGAVCAMYIDCWDGIEANWALDPMSPYAKIGGKLTGVSETFTTPEYGAGDDGTGSLSISCPPGTRYVSMVGSYAVSWLIFDTLFPSTRTGNVAATKVMPAHCSIDGGLTWLPDANPAHMIYECLTNTDWGMGADPTTIHTASFMASALTLFNEKFGLSMTWIQQSNIEKMVSEIIDHIQAFLYLDPEDGLWHLDLLRDDYDAETLDLLDESNSVATNRQRKALGELTGEIIISFKDAQTEEDKTITFHDNAVIAAQSASGEEIVSATRNYYGIRNDTLANFVGNRDMRAAAYPLFSADVSCTRAVGHSIRPGSVRRLSNAEDGITNMVVRVMRVDYGAPGDRMVKLKVVEDIFGLDKSTYSSIASTGWVDPTVKPTEITVYQFDTMPVPFMQRAGAATPDIEAPEYPNVGMVGYAYLEGAKQYDLATYVVNDNGEAGIRVVATNEIKASGTITYTLAVEIETDMSAAQIAEFAPGKVIEEGDFMQFGTSEADSEIAMVRTKTTVPLPTPIPDTPVWTEVAPTTPTLYSQADGVIEITHTGSMSKTEAYLTQADPDANFDIRFAVRVNLPNDTFCEAGVFIGDDSVDRKQVSIALDYEGDVSLRTWEADANQTHGKAVYDVTNAAPTDQFIAFRVVRSDSRIWLYYSLTGTTDDWNLVASFDDLAFIPLDNTAQIGVYLYSGSVTAGVVSDMVLEGMDTTLWPTAFEYKITRGIFDTIPREWPPGTRGWFLEDNGDSIDPTEAASGTLKTYKIMSRTDGGVFPQNRAEVIYYTPSDRPYQPFRPGNTKLDGVGIGEADLHYIEGSIPATVTATWSIRDRFTQDVVALAWDDSGEVPEVGQETILRVYERYSGTLMLEETGLTGETYDIDLATLIDYRFYDVKFFSSRDTYESLTAATLGLDIERLGYSNNYDYDYDENDGS